MSWLIQLKIHATWHKKKWQEGAAKQTFTMKPKVTKSAFGIAISYIKNMILNQIASKKVFF